MNMKKNLLEVLKEYNDLEDNNDHTAAASLLVDVFGTDEEKDIMKGILIRHERNGHIIQEDYQKRYEVSQKYFVILRGMTKPKGV
jgi:flagellar motor switch protein FliG